MRWRKIEDKSLFARPCTLGLAMGSVFFALALTPSLIPRTAILQGVLAGLCFGTGYLIGFGLRELWLWLFASWEGRNPKPDQGAQKLWPFIMSVLFSAGWVIWALSNVTGWQNDIHAAMHMPAVESARPWTILGIASLVGLILVGLGRFFRRGWLILSAQLEMFIPPRLARFSALVAAIMVVNVIGNDFLVSRILQALDRSYAAVDRLIESDQSQPIGAFKTGAEQSLIPWSSLGAEGRNWIEAAPTAEDISQLTGRPALDPLRIYVGLNSAQDADARAELALSEALRIGAFERGTLVLAMPTGTGWMDEAAFGPLDYLSDGDVATIGVQYSYLPSWMSLFLQPEYGAETARAVFRVFYGHWVGLDPQTRPKLYLFGLSLGARNGEIPISWPDLISDPISGALWVGPPFAMTGWQNLRATRNADSPEWALRYRQGSAIRAMIQAGVKTPNQTPYAPWGVMRMVYLAYPSDPIAYFTTDIFWREPDWMKGQRGPDVSQSLRWWPVVTFLQLGFDMMTATSTPPGFGHVYAARDYIEAWDEVLGQSTSSAELARLKGLYAAQGM